MSRTLLLERNMSMEERNCCCDETCTCGCQEGQECTCDESCDCEECNDSCNCGCQEDEKSE